MHLPFKTTIISQHESLNIQYLAYLEPHKASTSFVYTKNENSAINYSEVTKVWLIPRAPAICYQ
jgi:hypothetical protein